jgi:predicted enzyme related to lactoylglutathione lyase
MQKRDAITWFEIPAADLGRAKRFYETVLGVELKNEQMGPQKMALFPYETPGIGGCITAGDGNQPSGQGSLVYLQAGSSLNAALGRVERAGGRISLGQTELPDGMGFFAHILDTEGNRVGLHALA